MGKGLRLAFPLGLTQLSAWAHQVAKGLQSLSQEGEMLKQQEVA